MSTILIYDSLRAKKVRFTIRTEATLARLREEFSVDETIPILLAERGPEDDSDRILWMG